MKIIVTGARGQLGTDLVKELSGRDHEITATDIDDLDITDRNAVLGFVEEIRPDAVIHLAAYTNVDGAESNYDLCMKVNGTGTENIAAACRKYHAKMLYISTDYVFSGEGDSYWQPDDVPAPVNLYGLSKLRGEEAVKRHLSDYFIVRISWVFGKNGKNFVGTMLRLGRERERLSVVSDQVGSPTYTVDLSRLIADMIVTDKFGVYHASNEGICSWYEYAKEIFRLSGLPVEVAPVLSCDYPSAAKRPLNSRLNKDKLKENGFEPLPHWKDALVRFLKECEN